MELKFYYCEDCGNLVILLQNSGVPIVCCGQKMIELVPGAVDASPAKHVPVYRTEGERVYVSVGAAEHPMTEEHFIGWIAIQTARGVQYVEFQPGDKPEASFLLQEDDELQAVYAVCSLHGLWKA